MPLFRKKKGNQLKLLFSTDIHGSTMVFKKFLKALEVYGVDIGIIGGDLSGKFIVPIIMRKDGKYECKYLGKYILTDEKKRLKEFEKNLENMGSYYVYITDKEFRELLAEGKTLEGRIDEKVKGITLSTGKTEKIFEEVVIERLRKWLELAEERLRNLRKKLYIIPGNDDLPVIDQVIKEYESDHIIFADSKVVNLDGYEMVGLSWSNPTPWNTPREVHEEELKRKIDELVSKINNMERAIFQFHAPPYGTMLDEAPKLDKQLRPSVSESINVGSRAVREAIEKYQPLLGLHGHIHESKGIERIGRTYVINPGSEYTEGILRGVIVILQNGKFKNYIFTSG